MLSLQARAEVGVCAPPPDLRFEIRARASSKSQTSRADQLDFECPSFVYAVVQKVSHASVPSERKQSSDRPRAWVKLSTVCDSLRAFQRYSQLSASPSGRGGTDVARILQQHSTRLDSTRLGSRRLGPFQRTGLGGVLSSRRLGHGRRARERQRGRRLLLLGSERGAA